MPEQDFDPVAILATLNRHGVRYVVVGGFAVAAHGVVRATEDLDLVVERAWENAARLADALKELEARAEGGKGALRREALVRPADRELETRHGRLHLLHEVRGVPSYPDLLPAKELRIDDQVIPVCSIEKLREMKRAGDRPKDRIDLAELEALEDA